MTLATILLMFTISTVLLCGSIMDLFSQIRLIGSTAGRRESSTSTMQQSVDILFYIEVGASPCPRSHAHSHLACSV